MASEPEQPSVLYDVRGDVAWITLNRPSRLNAITAEMSVALVDALRRAAEDPVRAVVLTGAGRGFCSGSDLHVNFGPGQVAPSDALRRFRHPIVLGLRALDKPVICAVNGPAAGIGASIALAADFVIAAEGASMSFAFVRLGLIPDGGATWFLTRALPPARATELALLGEPLSAAEAASWGLIGRCVPDDTLIDETTALAERLARGPTRAYALARAALDAAPANGLAEHLELEARLQGQAAATPDFAEGLDAFIARREPRFRGAT